MTGKNPVGKGGVLLYGRKGFTGVRTSRRIDMPFGFRMQCLVCLLRYPVVIGGKNSCYRKGRRHTCVT